MNACIIPTYTGQLVDVFNPDPSTIRLQDIGHQLSQINRYFGMPTIPISVGEHTVKMSWVTEVITGSKDLAREAMLHDASESFLGELVRQLKRSPAMVGYREAEKKFDTVIRAKYRQPLEMSVELDTIDKAFSRVEITKSGLFKHPKVMIGLTDNGLQETANKILEALVNLAESMRFINCAHALEWGWKPVLSEWSFRWRLKELGFFRPECWPTEDWAL